MSIPSNHRVSESRNMFNATAQNRFVPYGAQYYTSLFLNYWEFLSKKDSD